jgi:hypothetical protein
MENVNILDIRIFSIFYYMIDWSNLPNEIIYKILLLLPIDTKLSLKVKPRKIPDDIITKLNREISKIKHRYGIYYRNETEIAIETIKYINSNVYKYYIDLQGNWDYISIFSISTPCVRIWQYNNNIIRNIWSEIPII